MHIWYYTYSHFKLFLFKLLIKFIYKIALNTLENKTIILKSIIPSNNLSKPVFC